MKKYYGLAAGLAMTFLLTGCGNGTPVLEYKYEDNNVPGTKYEISLYENNRLVVKETKHCNYENCKDKKETHKTELTKEEYDKVIEVTKKENYSKEELSISLSSIVRDKEVKASLEKDGEANWNVLYKDYDTDNDKILTYREYGNSLLDRIVEEGDTR
ncbi:MAG: hypothetical protein IJ193_04770 [Bacilli bacterium]|nr:hypothetical protein [Bacilli bacterium]